ncbi:NAD(P)-binding protein [Boletus edulis]|uniref:NAD(P)-binding protein n=1 Tax=Boletus edulis BED1 TaxID=1328754 RepID=A0AAD4BWH8_BOLED|nr:NAD(P)-binding protein [Boletus edulis]KAF8441560.1 NAD(P)-binding protein [Boletus edulis BED1]
MPKETRGSQPARAEHHQRTLTRLEQIQSHLKKTSRGQRLSGKVCIITGVSSLHGIGRASALLFAHEGAKHLYLLDYSSENLPELKSTIQSSYPDVKVTTIKADAADDSAIAAVCEQAVDEEGQLDVFFANAGVATNAGLHDTSAERFMETLRINSLSCFLAVKYGSQAMMRTNPSSGKTLSSGSIILTASVAGLRSGAGTIDYSASKAAVNSIAKTSVYQLQKTDVRVNSICPGLIETNMTMLLFDTARERGKANKIGQLNPMGRYGVPQEIAQMALFLASDESSYVNGQNIAVDGALSSSIPVIPGHWA